MQATRECSRWLSSQQADLRNRNEVIRDQQGSGSTEPFLIRRTIAVFRPFAPQMNSEVTADPSGRSALTYLPSSVTRERGRCALLAHSAPVAFVRFRGRADDRSTRHPLGIRQIA